jgi:hypothetical protein
MTGRKSPPLITIYTTPGDVGAYLQYPYLFNFQGEWIGWVNSKRQVYSVRGHYVGWLSDEPRILRKQSSTFFKPEDSIPPVPEPIQPPVSTPLAPMMPELPYGVIDVLEDASGLLPSYDFGDLTQDMD